MAIKLYVNFRVTVHWQISGLTMVNIAIANEEGCIVNLNLENFKVK